MVEHPAIHPAPATATGPVRAVLFDLDGTLIDSLADIASSVNQLLEEDGRDRLCVDEVRGMVGHGIAKLVERALAARGGVPAPPALSVLVARMMEIYGANLTVGTVTLPGACEVLGDLARKGYGLAVVTNKPEAMSRRILAHFGVSADVAVIGGDTCPTRKPEPQMLLHAAGLLGVSPRDAVMVGDSAADIDAARAAGMRCIAIAGGYGHGKVEELGADALVACLAEVPQVIEGWNFQAGSNPPLRPGPVTVC